MARNNVIRMNTLHLNSVRLNGIGEVQSVSLSAGADPEQPPVEPSKYIQFEDPAVEAICVANWSSDGIGLTMEDAAAVTSLGTVFYNNTEITSFDELQYFTGVTSLKENAFRNCTALTWLNLKNIVSIGVVALRGCTSLAGDYILDKLKTIDYGSFQNTAISSIAAPNVTTIVGFRDYGAFANCKSLKNAYFPLVTNIGRQAFQNCSSLETIYMPNVTGIGTYAFDRCSSLSGDLILEYLTGSLGEATFRGTSITSFVAPLLTSIIGFRDEGCFMNCKSLKSVDISSVTIIGQQAFQGSALADIKMGSVTSIDQQAFQGCSALSIIDIPSGVTTIGSYAFYQSSSLESIICRPTTPPTLTDTYALQNTNNCPIYVPDASLEAYKTATNWSTYADRIHPLSEIEGSPYIQFEDPVTEAICTANWSSDGVGLTKEDAAAVTSLGTAFKDNTEITSFNELEYFTGVKSLTNA